MAARETPLPPGLAPAGPPARLQDPDLAAPPVLGAPAARLESGPAAPPYVGRPGPALGFGEGVRALDTARELGVPALDPDEGLPGLRGGAAPHSARLLSQGEQSLLNPLVDAGGSYLDVHPDPYLKP